MENSEEKQKPLTSFGKTQIKSVLKNPLKEFLKDPKVKRILDGPFNVYEKIWRLHHLHFDNPTIQVLLGCTKNSVTKGIWLHKKGYIKNTLK